MNKLCRHLSIGKPNPTQGIIPSEQTNYLLVPWDGHTSRQILNERHVEVQVIQMSIQPPSIRQGTHCEIVSAPLLKPFNSNFPLGRIHTLHADDHARTCVPFSAVACDGARRLKSSQRFDVAEISGGMLLPSFCHDSTQKATDCGRGRFVRVLGTQMCLGMCEVPLELASGGRCGSRIGNGYNVPRLSGW